MDIDKLKENWIPLALIATFGGNLGVTGLTGNSLAGDIQTVKQVQVNQGNIQAQQSVLIDKMAEQRERQATDEARLNALESIAERNNAMLMELMRRTQQ